MVHAFHHRARRVSVKAPTAVARSLGDIHIAERSQVAVRTFEDAWNACCVGPLQGFKANLRE